MTPGTIVIGILGVAMLMVVHEAGHYFAARYFGMRVTTFSIGFGPPLWKYQGPDSPTVFQVALIPFLAYVKIAGINPFEEIDPDDKGSYANASLAGRIVTIAAGPVVNYLFASILFFAGVLIAGKDETDPDSLRIDPVVDGPAYIAGVRAGDKVLEVDGAKIKTWAEMKAAVSKRAGEPVDLSIRRGSDVVHMYPTPIATGDLKGLIRMQPTRVIRHVGISEALKFSVTEPASVVKLTLVGMARMASGKEKAQFLAPHEVVGEVAQAVGAGAGYAFQLLGALSAYLGAFNLLPLPALDGGRIIFLLYELVSRKRPDAKLEAKIHAVGILVFLTFTMVLTVSRIFKH